MFKGIKKIRKMPKFSGTVICLGFVYINVRSNYGFRAIKVFTMT